MTNTELIAVVANDTLCSKKTATEIINGLVARITKELKDGQDVVLQGFDKFTVKATAARKGRNPSTGEAIDIPAKKRVAFTVHKSLKDAIQ